MSDALEFEGTIIDSNHNVFRVECEIGGHKRIIQTRVAGRLYMRHIRITPGDRVKIEVSPYDLSRGRIVYRIR